MSKTDEGREPIDVLYSIEDKVSQLATTNSQNPGKPRYVPSREDTAHRVLVYLKENGESTSTEVNEHVEGDATRPLAKLYHTYLVNRSGVKFDPYSYEISELGRRVLEHGQQTLIENGGKKEKPEPSAPWEGLDIGRADYYAIKSVRETGGNPRSNDVNETFLGLSGLEEHTSKGPTVGPYLSKLYKEGYLNRTPNRPYRYWVTDKGLEMLPDKEE